VIQGANGAGKSNLLNAITWCLYGEERHLQEENNGDQLPIINEKVFDELQPGETAVMEVELALGREEIEYFVNRRAKAYRQKDGEVSIREDTDPRVRYRVRENWRTSEQPTYAINSLLPADISHFFFFDGEQLDRFFQEDSTEQVRKGIVNVSQIHLLNRATDHLESVRTDIRRKADGISPEIDEINEQIDSLDQKLKECRENLEALREDRRGLQENLEDIRQGLRTSSSEEVRHLQQARDSLTDQVKDYEAQLVDLRAKANQVLREAGPRVYAYPAVREAYELIEEGVKHGDLPPKVRAPFFRDLLAHEQCVCGRDLPEGSPAREEVERRLREAPSEGYESAATEGKYQLGGMLDGVRQIVARQREIGKEIRRVEQAIESSDRQLREISEKIERLGGDVNLEEVEVLERQHREYQEKWEEVCEEIGREEGEEERLEQELKQLNGKLERALEAAARRKDLLARFELCTQALTALDEIRTELLSEVRQQIEQETEEYFLDLIWKKGTYSRVQIDENYQINVLNVRGLPSLGTLSAGERQVLALAFMAALGTISGFDAPVLIDTPIGRISGEPRKNIAESLPNYLSDTQVTLLMTDTEYTEPVQMRLNSRIGKEYELRFVESEAITEVITL
jgi:DNA sulfur modification protein DndD